MASAKAIFRGETKRIQFTPTADIPCGSIVVVGGVIGVATSAIPANTPGELQIGGDYDVVYTSNASPKTGMLVRATIITPAGVEKTGCPVGIALEDVTSSKKVRVKLLPYYLWQNFKTFSTAATYGVGDIVLNSNKFYVCKTAVSSAGTFSGSSWNEVSGTITTVTVS